jgi:hypothetical protein
VALLFLNMELITPRAHRMERDCMQILWTSNRRMDGSGEPAAGLNCTNQRLPLCKTLAVSSGIAASGTLAGNV